jgi:Carboxypeptidase regulatory-like domain
MGPRCKLVAANFFSQLVSVREEPLRRAARKSLAPASFLVWMTVGLLFAVALPAVAQSQESPSRFSSAVQNIVLDAPKTDVCGVDQHNDQELPGSITGMVVDPTGNGVAGAKVALSHENQSRAEEQLSGDDGQYSFTNVSPGPFHLSVSSPGFATQTVSGTLTSGESCVVPQLALAVATNVTEVHVELSTIEIAQQEITDQEKQRLFGVIPNFYVTYVPNAAPLTPRQKFQLAWKSTIDPVSFGVTGVTAGVEQATDKFSGYGQGAQGYGKRYGAAYADLVTGTFIGGAILPALLKQDPRYFYKGTGTARSRALYAIANAVICKGDNGHWQPNYSGIAGSLASGGISNLYYPDSAKSDAALTFENALIGIGETAAVNLLQEFVMRRLTPNLPKTEPVASTTP